MLKGVLKMRVEDLRTRLDGGEEQVGLSRDEDKMAKGVWLFKGLEKSVLGSFVHSVSRGDDKKTISSFPVGS